MCSAAAAVDRSVLFIKSPSHCQQIREWMDSEADSICTSQRYRHILSFRKKSNGCATPELFIGGNAVARFSLLKFHVCNP
jgi:hypothetical protein